MSYGSRGFSDFLHLSVDSYEPTRKQIAWFEGYQENGQRRKTKEEKSNSKKSVVRSYNLI